MLSMHFTTKLLWLWVVICLFKLTGLHEEKDVNFCFLQRGKEMVFLHSLRLNSRFMRCVRKLLFSLFETVLEILDWPVAVEQHLGTSDPLASATRPHSV